MVGYSNVMNDKASPSTRVVLLCQPGGPEQLRVEKVSLAPVGPNEVRVRQTAVGVNYHDVYVRSGLYKTLALPGVPGIEAVGLVEEVGASITRFKVGERVGYVSPGYGSYAERRNIPADLVLKLPATAMTDSEAAGSLLRALTACMLVTRVHPVKAGEFVLVHAAAGGMGQMLCRWASKLGATVIGTVGSRPKEQIARAAGARHVILYREEDLALRVQEITKGSGVEVVYDAVGADTFHGSLAALSFCGHLVNYGQASGPVEPVALSILAGRSLSLSRPILFHYMRTPDLLAALAFETFAAFADGLIQPVVPLEFSLEEAGEAHQVLESGRSPGAIVLIP